MKPDAEVAGAIEAIWRTESARVVAAVVRLTRDLALAEDFAQDALLAALEHWPRAGIPDKPGAWLTTTARRRAPDHLRHRQMAAPRHIELAHELDLRHALVAQAQREQVDAALDGDIGDDMLRLIFAACHVRAATVEQTDWTRIAALYDALAAIDPSPVVAPNRAVAVGMAYGPAAGLECIDALRDEAALAHYHLLPSVRGDLLVRLGRGAEAAAEFERAASLTRNAREQALLLTRAMACKRTQQHAGGDALAAGTAGSDRK
ncbi:MAG: hypothetical protein KDI01_05685 [Halioglobus sp.]|nr:hypothetical protein [Halioglobus sp.]